MTSLLYLDLADLLTQAFAAVLEQEPPDGARVTPRVYVGDLPPKRNDRNLPEQSQGEDYPFALILPAGGEDGTNSFNRGEVTVKIAFGAYVPPDTEAREGVIAVQRLIDVARFSLLGLPGYMLSGKFELQLPFKWRLGRPGKTDGLQPHPYYHGEIETQWFLPPLENLAGPEERIRIYGAGYSSE